VRVDDVVIGLLDAAAGLVHQPAVVVAADAGLFDESIGEVGAPMRAVPVEEAETSALVLVEHEVLAHEANGLDRVLVEFARAADRHPVAAQKLSHRRARADLGEKAVLFGTQHTRPRSCFVALRRLLLEFPTSATAIYQLSAAALHCSTGPWNIAAKNATAVPPVGQVSGKSDSQRLSRSMRNVMSLTIEKIIDISLELDPKNFGMRTPAGFKKDMQFEMETLKEHDAPGGAGQIVRGVHM